MRNNLYFEVNNTNKHTYLCIIIYMLRSKWGQKHAKTYICMHNHWYFEVQSMKSAKRNEKYEKSRKVRIVRKVRKVDLEI